MKTRIHAGSERNIRMLAQALRRGELVGVPTETVYGLAANALDKRACRGIFAAKRRPATDPLIVHVLKVDDLEPLAEVSPEARKLAARFWPGPLTLILRKKAAVPGIVTAGLESVAVRVPRHRLFRRLLKACGLPLAAPSANPFGYVSPTSAEHVRAGLGGRIGHILDGGDSDIGLESTILDLREPLRPRLLRPGAINRRDLEKVLGRRVIAGGRAAAHEKTAQVAPGLLSRHYSPRTPVRLHKRIARREVESGSDKEAWLFFRRPDWLGRQAARPMAGSAPAIAWLDVHGDPRGAAHRLFAELRRLDAGGFQVIHAELAPAGELAEAINDRLRRAAAVGR